MFIAKQVMFLALAAAVMVVRLAAVAAQRAAAGAPGLPGALLLTAMTLVFGSEIKGARRWMSSADRAPLQPSEFLKPCFAVVAAWLLAEGKARRAGAPRPGDGPAHPRVWPWLPSAAGSSPCC